MDRCLAREVDPDLRANNLRFAIIVIIGKTFSNDVIHFYAHG